MLKNPFVGGMEVEEKSKTFKINITIFYFIVLLINQKLGPCCSIV